MIGPFEFLYNPDFSDIGGKIRNGRSIMEKKQKIDLTLTAVGMPLCFYACLQVSMPRMYRVWISMYSSMV